MEDEGAQVLVARDVLDAFPFLAMVINEDYEVIIANTWFAESFGEPPDGCPLKCYETIRSTDKPRPDCSLAEAIRTDTIVEREITADLRYPLRVTIYPLPIRDLQGRRLFLDLVRSA